MVKNAIKIYGRIKPNPKRKEVGEYYTHEGASEETLYVHLKEHDEYLSNKPVIYQFKFRKVFDQNAKQHEVFSLVARPIVDSVLQGYNGTVFAYGQTGSGKTFTITGGPNCYEDRGLIPRTIQYIFQKINSAENAIYTACITYLEIYNEVGYDLLDPKHHVTRIEDLPRVTFLEDTTGHLHIRNLSLHPVRNEQEALNLLFLGDTNRTIAETPMNPTSSRSHCVFTIHLAIRKSSWKTVRRSKMHLVDLAGSERVHKTSMEGRSLLEARHINLSLHFLEQVITALAEPGRGHVPYRNCMMTTVLRDSLGGNCLTSMVATLSIEMTNIQETISTCRFSQRVALVSNEAVLNEERDPLQEISVLKSEVKKLKDQIAVLTGGQNLAEDLSPDEVEHCREIVHGFVGGTSNLDLPTDLRKIRLCCQLLKQAVHDAKSVRPNENSPRMQKCIAQLRQRDNEIAILTDLLRKEKKRYTKTNCESGASSPKPNSQNEKSMPDDYQRLMSRTGLILNEAERGAFKQYAADPSHTTEVDHVKSQLKLKYETAKKVAMNIEGSKAKIVQTRKMLDKLTSAVASSPTIAFQQKELKTRLQSILETEQMKYRENLSILQDLKNETDHLKHSVEQAKVRLLHRFQDWWSSEGRNDGTPHGSGSQFSEQDGSTSGGSPPKDENFVCSGIQITIKRQTKSHGSLNISPSNTSQVSETRMLPQGTSISSVSDPKDLTNEISTNIGQLSVRCRSVESNVSKDLKSPNFSLCISKNSNLSSNSQRLQSTSHTATNGEFQGDSLQQIRNASPDKLNGRDRRINKTTSQVQVDNSTFTRDGTPRVLYSFDQDMAKSNSSVTLPSFSMAETHAVKRDCPTGKEWNTTKDLETLESMRVSGIYHHSKEKSVRRSLSQECSSTPHYVERRSLTTDGHRGSENDTKNYDAYLSTLTGNSGNSLTRNSARKSTQTHQSEYIKRAEHDKDRGDHCGQAGQSSGFYPNLEGARRTSPHDFSLIQVPSNAMANMNYVHNHSNATENDIEYISIDSSTESYLQKIPLTGDKEVDEEILAFYKAKHEALKCHLGRPT